MAGPGALLLLGGLLGGLPQIWGGSWGGPGGAETPPELEEEEVSIVRGSEPLPPHCFTRTLQELSCFWESPGEPDPARFRFQFRLEGDPWQDCPLRAAALSPREGSGSGSRARFWCHLPPTATVTFVPLELRVLPGTPPGTPPPLLQRTIHMEQLVLPGPPRNVSVTPGGGRGELCVRWAPPPGPYLSSSLVFELALSPPGGPPKTVGVPAGRREQGVRGLRGSARYAVRARARPDGVSYSGFWSPWSHPGTGTTPPDVDGLTVGLSSLLVLLLLGLGILGVLGHRRTLQAKLWPPVPGPEREFEGLFSACGGNFQLWLCQSSGSPCPPPAPPPLELEDSVEEVGEGPGLPPPPAPPPPEAQTPPPGPGPAPGPSPSPSFEYTLFEPGSALLRPSPYANLAPPPRKGPAPKWGDHAPHYVTCS